MIEAKDILLFFGSIISLLLVGLSVIVWYWAQRVDKRFFYLERDQDKNRIDIELIKQNCRNRRKNDTGKNICTI